MHVRSTPAHWRAQLGLAAALALLGGCGGGGGTAGPDPAPPATNAAALSASKPGDMLAAVKTLLAARQAAGYSSNTAPPSTARDMPIGAVATTQAGAPLARSNTTVQEAGVDEADLLKADADIVYSVDTTTVDAKGSPLPRLNLHRRAADGRVTLLQGLDMLAGNSSKDSSAGDVFVSVRGMLLAPPAKRLAMLAQNTTHTGGGVPCPKDLICPALTSLIYWPGSLSYQTQVQAIELGSNATLGTLLSISGQLVDSRQIGNTLYLVTTHTPQLVADQLPAGATQAERDAALAKLGIADVLPTVRVNGGAAQALVSDTDCFAQAKNASLELQVTTITAIDLSAAGLPRQSRCVLGGTEAIYMSPTSLYLATSRNPYVVTAGALVYAPQATTDLHKFSVAGQAINYRGSGEVPGHLGWINERKPYRLSEHNGDLRVLSFTGQTGWVVVNDAAVGTTPRTDPSPATLTVLRERSSDQSLQVLAKLPNAQRPQPLGHAGEQVYGVRFAGDRGYVVTFRQTDPLYVLDLSNPADPRQVGELQVPGFSDFLFPLDNGLLLGVGRDADATGRVGGVKVALFDVKDAAQPKALSSQVLGQQGSSTALDLSVHGINLFQQGNTVRVALPTQTYINSVWQAGLQRFEVDTAQRTLLTKPMLGTAKPGWVDLSGARALQFDNQVVYLEGGQLSGWIW